LEWLVEIAGAPLGGQALEVACYELFVRMNRRTKAVERQVKALLVDPSRVDIDNQIHSPAVYSHIWPDGHTCPHPAKPAIAANNWPEWRK